MQVTLTRAFEIGQFEVTNQQWLDAGFERPLRNHDVGRCLDADCPASNMNLYEALTFANRYSETRGLAPCYELRDCRGTFGSGPICSEPGEDPGTLECERTEEDGLDCDGLFTTAADVYQCEGYRLATEAEWEYAARAGTRTGYWTGPVSWFPVLGDCNCEPALEPIAWYCSNGGMRQHKVGKKEPNPWGLYDMLGNVDEWTAEPRYPFGYGEGPLVDPAGYWWEVAGKADRNLTPVADYGGKVSRQDTIVNRGGNYTYPASSNKASARSIVLRAFQGGSPRGLRLARTLPE